MGVTLAKIEAVNSRLPWHPWEWHRVQPAQVRFEPRAWKVVPKQGVMVQGETQVRRTTGNPDTLKRVFLQYGGFATEFWDPALVLAVIANESRGELMCERFEGHINDWSFGPGQFLTNTAWGVCKDIKIVPPDVPIPKGGNVETWRKWLCDRKNCLPLIRAFLNNLNKRFALQHDPLLIYTAYNAGSPRPSTKSDWGLVTNRPDTLDRLAAWYGDAWYVINNMSEPKGVA